MKDKVKILALIIVVAIVFNIVKVNAEDYGDDGWTLSSQHQIEIMYIERSYIKDINGTLRNCELDKNNKKINGELYVTCYIGSDIEGWSWWSEIIKFNINLNHLDWDKYDYEILYLDGYANHNPGRGYLMGNVNYTLHRKQRNSEPDIILTQPSANSPLLGRQASVRGVV